MEVKFKTNLATLAKEKEFLNGKTLADLPALPAYLVNFAAGREATPASEWGNNLGLFTSEDVKNNVAAVIDTYENCPRLREYEFERLTQKYGPQGWIYPLGSDEFIQKVNAYYTACHNPCKVSDKTKKAYIDWLLTADLDPYTPDQVITRALEKTGLKSNSGTPDFTKRNKNISQALTLMDLVQEYNFSDDPGHYEYRPATVVGARSIKQKMRLIFMAPFSQNIVELGYVYALMDWLLAHSTAVNGWRGPDSTADAMQAQFRANVTHLSTDFTAMDTSVGRDQIAMFMDVYQYAFKAKYRPAFKAALRRIHQENVIAGVVKSPGIANISRNKYTIVYLSGDHGLFSGLGWTNLIETGLALLLDAEFRQFYPVLATEVNGDDGEKTIDGHRDLDKVAETFARLATRMGFTCNPSKQWVSYDEVRYLQRIYSPETERNGYTHGAYPFALTMNSIKNPERLANLSTWQQAERVLSISNNGIDHPYWRENIEYILRGQPALIEWLETGVGEQEMQEAFANAAGSGDLEGSNFENQEVFSGLKVVKYLQEHSAGILASLRR